MSNYERPLPLITEEAKPFWEACKQHKLVLQKCKSCGQVQHYPRIICTNCWSSNFDWIESSGKGVIYSFTIINRAPAPGFKPIVPFVIAIIDLKEGVRMLSNLIKVKPEDIKIGMPVKVEFEDATQEVSLPQFTLA